jgi:hypothetical protein
VKLLRRRPDVLVVGYDLTAAGDGDGATHPAGREGEVLVHAEVTSSIMMDQSVVIPTAPSGLAVLNQTA